MSCHLKADLVSPFELCHSSAASTSLRAATCRDTRCQTQPLSIISFFSQYIYINNTDIDVVSIDQRTEQRKANKVASHRTVHYDHRSCCYANSFSSGQRVIELDVVVVVVVVMLQTRDDL